MVRRSDELAREIAETREELGDRLIELRQRGTRAARRSVQIALVAGALAGAAVVGIVAWRLSRPPTMQERARRLLPARRLPLLRLPAFRVQVNDKTVAESGRTPAEKLVIAAARAAGTAAATAAVGVLLKRFAGRKA